MKLLDLVSIKLRFLHYSKNTETSYVSWIRKYIIFHHKKHPAEMGKVEIEMTSGSYPNPFDSRVWALGRIVEELAIPYRFP